jgi:hypothetical protein
MVILLALGLILPIPALAIEQPSMEKCWSDTLYRQYDCPAVGWPYGTITQEQAERLSKLRHYDRGRND